MVFSRKDVAAEIMSCFFERIYIEWDALKADGCAWVEERRTWEMTEARFPGARSQMTKAEQRAYASMDMVSAALLHAICVSDIEQTKKALDMTDESYETLVGDLQKLRNQTENKKQDVTAVCQTDPKEWSAEDWAACRLQYVSLLAEWTQMHDNHEPFPHGTPAASQACAKIENANTEQRRIYCGKLFPRNTIPPGGGDITVDPHRKDLYRLWLARNCNFINNFVPLLMLLVQNNMDCQACTSKAGVIEYMTKYMTTAGSGSMLQVMETSFAKCMEKAINEEKGAKSAISKFLNTVAASDVKCQGDTLHLAFDLPRVLCSRDFTRLSLKPLLKRLKAPEEVEEDDSSVLAATALDRYKHRAAKYECPSQEEWNRTLPNTVVPLWKHVNARVPDGDQLTPDVICSKEPEHMHMKAHQWKKHLQLTSLWEFVRLYQPAEKGKSLKLKPKSNVIILSHKPLFQRYYAGPDYKTACVHALLAYMNWGPACHIKTSESRSVIDIYVPAIV